MTSMKWKMAINGEYRQKEYRSVKMEEQLIQTHSLKYTDELRKQDKQQNLTIANTRYKNEDEKNDYSKRYT